MKMESAIETYLLMNKISVGDFSFQKLIGEGAYGEVFLARNIHTNQKCAIKVIDREMMKTNGVGNYIDAEIDAHHILSECTNLDLQEMAIYCNTFVTDHFSLDAARYYAAELLLGIEMLHSKGIIHRDLKPENILLDENWHIRIIDFGFAKVLGKENKETMMDLQSTNDMIGTPEYISPEVFNHSEGQFASDLWAFGCIIYQMVSGIRLFDRRVGTIFEMIEDLDCCFRNNFNRSAKDLVKQLLVVEPEQRLGALDSKPYQSIRNHKFFRCINWNDLGEPPKITPNDWDSSESEEVVYNTPGFNCEILDKLYADTGREKNNFDEVELEEIDYVSEEDFSSFPRRMK